MRRIGHIATVGPKLRRQPEPAPDAESIHRAKEGAALEICNAVLGGSMDRATVERLAVAGEDGVAARRALEILRDEITPAVDW